MKFDSIIERGLVVKTLGTDVTRNLKIRIGKPIFISLEGVYFCPTDYGWFIREVPNSFIEEFVGCKGVDPVHALLRAIDMSERLHLFRGQFRFYLPQGDLLFDYDNYDETFHRQQEVRYELAKKKGSKMGYEEFFYTDLIESMEEKIRELRNSLQEKSIKTISHKQ